MGCRGNIVIGKPDSDSPKVFLYTHWDGGLLIHMAQEALSKRWRWDDPQYLSRIVFDVMVDEQQGGETGYGISSEFYDTDVPLIVLDCADQTVSIIPATFDKNAVKMIVLWDEPLAKFTFEEFIKVPQTWGELKNYYQVLQSTQEYLKPNFGGGL